eukprot:m.73679 g.73679  ORF g.73679 m.73679 type:complete len:152 (-) comp16130_c1_seq2:284-739(-)
MLWETQRYETCLPNTRENTSFRVVATACPWIVSTCSVMQVSVVQDWVRISDKWLLCGLRCMLDDTGVLNCGAYELHAMRTSVRGGSGTLTNIVCSVQHIDGFLQITDEEATLTARRLAAEEGIMGTISQQSHSEQERACEPHTGTFTALAY